MRGAQRADQIVELVLFGEELFGDAQVELGIDGLHQRHNIATSAEGLGASTR